MKWFKDIVIDLLVSVFILAAVLIADPYLTMAVIIYSSFILISKLIFLTSKVSDKSKKKLTTAVPQWAYHLLYGFNTVILFAYQWWYTAACWLLIWIASAIYNRRTKPAK